MQPVEIMVAGNFYEIISPTLFFPRARITLSRTWKNAEMQSMARARVEKKIYASLRAGFEPARVEPNGFQVHLLNRSDIVATIGAIWWW